MADYDRTINALMELIRTHREERVRATVHGNSDGVHEADYIYLLEAALADLALASDQSPSRLIAATALSLDDEASIMEEVL